MKIIRLIVTALSAVIGVYIFWVTFIFNLRMIQYDYTPALIRTYIAEGGIIHISIIGILAIITLILFIIYAINDSSKIELFNDGFEVTLHKKDNLFSFIRICQFLVFSLVVINSITCLYRLYTLDPKIYYTYVFDRHWLVLGFTFMSFYLLFITGSLIFEIINDKNVQYY